MAVVQNSPFESKYGFKSPSFTVDIDGNIQARSITTSQSDDILQLPADFTFSEFGNEFVVAELGTSNPELSINRGETYIIDLTLPNFGFSIFSDTSGSFYSSGLSHIDGSSGDDAQEKTSGRLQFRVPLNAPDRLYYGKADKSVFIQITVNDPAGLFGSLQVSGITEATSLTTASATFAGGVAITKSLLVGGDINIDGDLNIQGTGIPALLSPTNLILGAENKVILKIADLPIGEINSTGSTIPLNSTTIDNTIIGATTPASATFTEAFLGSGPSGPTSATNKQYVDSTSIALAIAFGI